MKIKHLVSTFALMSVCCIGGNHVYGQNQLADTIRLTEDQLLAMARAENLQYKLIGYLPLTQEQKMGEAKSRRYPHVRFSGRASLLSPVDEFSIQTPIFSATLFPSITEHYQLRLSAQQILYAGDRISGSVNAAQQTLLAKKSIAKWEEDEILHQARFKYWHLVKAINAKKILLVSESLLKRINEDVMALHKKGMAIEIDVLKSEIRLMEIQTKIQEAEHGINLASMSIALILNAGLSSVIIPSDTLTIESERERINTSLDSLREIAIRNRLDLQGLRMNSKAAKSGISVARSDFLPQVLLTAGIESGNPHQRYLPPKAEWNNSWDVAFMIQWNLWDWGLTAASVSQAEVAALQAGIQEDILKNAIAIEVSKEYQSVSNAEKKLILVRLTETQAAKMLELVNEKYRQGLATMTELLESELNLLQARNATLDAQIEHRLAHIQLRKSVGLSQ